MSRMKASLVDVNSHLNVGHEARLGLYMTLVRLRLV